MSPYQYAALNPISFIDVNGDSIWVAPNEDGSGFTIHYEGKVINNSEHDIDMEELIGSIQQAFTDAGSGDVSFAINLTEAKSKSDLSSTDHVIHITDLSPTRDPDARGVVNKIGGKVAWVEQDMFSSDYLTQIKIFLGKEANPVRTIMHEMVHQMGQTHVDQRNLMQQNSRSRNLTPMQLRDISNSPPGTFNRGSNQYRFMPMRSIIKPSN